MCIGSWLIWLKTKLIKQSDVAVLSAFPTAKAFKSLEQLTLMVVRLTPYQKKPETLVSSSSWSIAISQDSVTAENRGLYTNLLFFFHLVQTLKSLYSVYCSNGFHHQNKGLSILFSVIRLQTMHCERVTIGFVYVLFC